MSIFLDFDGTITTQDTVKHIADFALRYQESQAPNGPSSSSPLSNSLNSQTDSQEQSDDKDNSISQQHDSDSRKLSERWDGVVQAYVQDYKTHVKGYHTQASDRLCAASEIAFQRSQKDVELASLDRINSCAVFRGIPASEFHAAGGALMESGADPGKSTGVTLRSGFKDFVRARLDQGYDVSVVSVNWSAAFIEGACGFAKDEITVYANEVREEDGAVLGPSILKDDAERTGKEEARNLTNSADKLDVFHAVLRDRKTERASFYFGDSCTDIECLLEATKGIVIADSEDTTLVQTLRRIGKKVPHVRDAQPSDAIVWASNYDEVMACVSFEPQ